MPLVYMRSPMNRCTILIRDCAVCARLGGGGSSTDLSTGCSISIRIAPGRRAQVAELMGQIRSTATERICRAAMLSDGVSLDFDAARECTGAVGSNDTASAPAGQVQKIVRRILVSLQRGPSIYSLSSLRQHSLPSTQRTRSSLPPLSSSGGDSRFMVRFLLSVTPM